MPAETRHESADLEDYSVQDPSDSLIGDPESDPWTEGWPRRNAGQRP
jgi:hypothetical protein